MRYLKVFALLLLTGWLLIGTLPVLAQVPSAPPADTARAHLDTVVTVQRDGGYTIAGLITHLKGVATFRYGVALFPGAPGMMKLRSEHGQPTFELGGNFLVRSRRHWVDEETLVVVIDAPSDQWTTFSQAFRATPRYGSDVAALLKEIGQQYPVEDWSFIGTSEGSVSAFHASRMNPALARRTILTASLLRPTRNGSALSAVNWNELPGKLLWVHHENDPCAYTAYGDAKEIAVRTGRPLVTVRGGGPWRGAACQAYTAHGFVGVEKETVNAMRSWIKTDVIPSDVTP